MNKKEFALLFIFIMSFKNPFVFANSLNDPKISKLEEVKTLNLLNRNSSLEGESGFGDGNIIDRDRASNKKTVLLQDDEILELSFIVDHPSFYRITVAYSNDNFDHLPLEDINLYIDDQLIGTFPAQDTSTEDGPELGPGGGWNIFITSDAVESGVVKRGSHHLKLEVKGGDNLGVEIDVIQFELITIFSEKSRIGNISTRGLVGIGEEELIAGFIISNGFNPRPFVIKGEGPILQLPGVITDPILLLQNFPSGEDIASNNNWVDHTTSGRVEATGAMPFAESEAAFISELGPRAYIARLSDVNRNTGMGIVSVTDLGLFNQGNGGDAELINISTRGLVGSGEAELKAGFIVTGSPDRPGLFLIKGEGPILAIPGIITDPKLELTNLNSGALIATVDDWMDHPTASQIPIEFRPSSSKESAFIVELGPGAYIASLSDVNGLIGLGLVSVTDMAGFVPPPSLLPDGVILSPGGNPVITPRGLNFEGSISNCNGIPMFEWNFGGGQPAFSNEKEPTNIRFNVPGNYTAVLTVSCQINGKILADPQPATRQIIVRESCNEVICCSGRDC